MRMHWILASAIGAVSMAAVAEPAAAQAADATYYNSYVSISGGVSVISEQSGYYGNYYGYGYYNSKQQRWQQLRCRRALQSGAEPDRRC